CSSSHCQNGDSPVQTSQRSYLLPNPQEIDFTVEYMVLDFLLAADLMVNYVFSFHRYYYTTSNLATQTISVESSHARCRVFTRGTVETDIKWSVIQNV
ncbi:MAG: hypothetical protein J7M12_03355, partial [Candidatus Hydrogenedentes bacterium]|nr:hypothetical protein [Candidatus Hydrogenedentota bacterium]